MNDWQWAAAALQAVVMRAQLAAAAEYMAMAKAVTQPPSSRQ